MAKHELLTELRAMRGDWETLVEDVGRERMNLPGAMGDDWTFKDLATHLTGWWTHSLVQLEAATRDQAPTPLDWPSEDVDQINAWLQQQSATLSYDEVLAEADNILRRLEEAVDALPDQTLTDPYHFSWLNGHALDTVVKSALEHFYIEHFGPTRAWLAIVNAETPAE